MFHPFFVNSIKRVLNKFYYVKILKMYYNTGLYFSFVSVIMIWWRTYLEQVLMIFLGTSLKRKSDLTKITLKMFAVSFFQLQLYKECEHNVPSNEVDD